MEAVHCPDCGEIIGSRPNRSGTEFECPQCNSKVQIPDVSWSPNEHSMAPRHSRSRTKRKVDQWLEVKIVLFIFFRNDHRRILANYGHLVRAKSKEKQEAFAADEITVSIRGEQE